MPCEEAGPAGGPAGRPARGTAPRTARADSPGPGDADVEQPALLLDLLVGRARTWIGSVPSTRPTRKTASHSRPLAACSEASVTPSHGRRVLGARPAASSSASEVGRGRRPAAPPRAPRRADQRGQRLPAVPGRAAGRRPSRARPAGAEHVAHQRRPACLAGLGRPGRAAQQQHRLADLGPVEEPLARRARTYGTPASASACSYDLGLRVDPEQHGDLAWPACRRRSAPAGGAATAAASAGSSACSAKVGSGPAGALPDQLEPQPAARRAACRSTRLASSTTCGVDR